MRLPLTLAAALLAGCVQMSQTSSTSSATMSAAAATTTGAPTIALAGDFKGPLGLELYTVRAAARADLPGTLARVRAMGFTEVETAGDYGLGAQRLRAALDAAGLRATSMLTGYERLRDSLPAVLADAKTLGARFVGTAWIPHPSGPITAEIARRTAADFDRMGRGAKAAGLQFFYHVHGYEFVPDAAGTTPMDIIMRETDPDAVKFEMDVFWMARPGADPVAWLRKYPTRWRLMHIKDMKPGTATNDHTGTAPPDETEVPIGQGMIDYRAVLRAAREVGVTQYYIEDETSQPFATVPQSVRWLSRVKF